MSTNRERDLERVRAWTTDRCTIDPALEVGTPQLLPDFNRWATSRGERPLSLRALGMALGDLGFPTRKTGGGRKVRIGLDLAAGRRPMFGDTGDAGRPKVAYADWPPREQVDAWMKSRCIVSVLSARAEAAALFRDYQSWASLNGHDPLSQTMFGRILGFLGFDVVRQGGNGRIMRRGIFLR